MNYVCGCVVMHLVISTHTDFILFVFFSSPRFISWIFFYLSPPCAGQSDGVIECMIPHEELMDIDHLQDLEISSDEDQLNIDLTQLDGQQDNKGMEEGLVTIPSMLLFFVLQSMFISIWISRLEISEFQDSVRRSAP